MLRGFLDAVLQQVDQVGARHYFVAHDDFFMLVASIHMHICAISSILDLNEAVGCMTVIDGKQNPPVEWNVGFQLYLRRLLDHELLVVASVSTELFEFGHTVFYVAVGGL